MATVTRKCAGCGVRFRVSNQSRRKFCERCRPPRLRALAADAPSAVPSDAPRVSGEVEASLRVVLEDAGRCSRYQAVLALRLARQLDSGTSVAGAQGLASQIDALMQAALKGYDPDPPEVTFVDGMRAAWSEIRSAAK